MPDAPTIDRNELLRQKLKLEKEILEAEIAQEEKDTPAVPTMSGGTGGVFLQNGRVRTPQQGDPPASPSGLAIDLTLEAGIPALGQFLATPLTPAGQAFVGSILSAVGNLLAQGRRMAVGEQPGFSWGQLTQATGTGMIPFAGPAVAGTRTIARAAKFAAETAGVGLAGEAIRTSIDEGRIPTFGEAVVSTMVPTTVGGVGVGIGALGQRRLARARRVGENAQTFGDAGVTPTPGMLDPTELGAFEQRQAARKREGSEAKAIDRTQTEMITALDAAAPSPRDGAAIWKDLDPLVGKIPEAEKTLGTLNLASKEADAKKLEAFRNLRSIEREQQGKVDVARDKALTEGQEAAQKANDDAFTANLESVLENARDIARTRMIAGANPLDPASARALQVKHVAEPAQAAFEEAAAGKYSLIDNNVKGFDPTPILDRASEITVKASGTLQKTLQTRIQDVRKMLGDEGMMVSLQDLRNVRDELSKSVKFGEMGNTETGLIKDLVSEISDQIDTQAVKVYGEVGAARLKEANQFYRETRGLFDTPGVEALFSPSINDPYINQVIRGLKTSGINAPEYKQLDDLISQIETITLDGPKAKDRKGALKRTPEEIAAVKEGIAAMRSQANENIRNSIIYQATELVGGEVRVSGDKLVDLLEPMAKVDGTMERLGFNSREAVGELKTLFAKYKDAPSLTTDQWNSLLASPSFREVKGSGDLRPTLEPYLAASAADTQLVRAAELKKAGYVDKAQQEYDKATDTLRGVNGDLAAAQTRFDNLVRNPLAREMNDAGLPDGGWSTFSKAFLNPDVTSHEDLRRVVGVWRNGVPAEKQTLREFQTRFITDRIATFAEASRSSSLLQEPNVKAIATFFDPKDALGKRNLQVAVDLLEPDQLQRLQGLAEVAKAMDRYERFGPELIQPGSAGSPLDYSVRRVWDFAIDKLREGNYASLARDMADPAAFVRAQRESGQRLDAAGRAIRQSGAQGAGRVLSR